MPPAPNVPREAPLAPAHASSRLGAGALLVITAMMALLVMAINVLLIVQAPPRARSTPSRRLPFTPSRAQPHPAPPAQFLVDYPTWAVVLVCLYGVFYFYCCYLMVAGSVDKFLRFTRRKLGGDREGNSIINEEGLVKPLPTAAP